MAQKGFNFEKNLQHQVDAVNSTLHIFDNMYIHKSTNEFSNNIIDIDNRQRMSSNILNLQKYNDIEESFSNENIFDIQMETGTGKTYTYTKTMFELNKRFGIFKFIVVVPTLSIKAGTVNFLKSDSLVQHFRSEYGKGIKTFVVDSKETKSDKKYFPNSISGFIQATKFSNNINVLIINSGMITNGKSLYETYDTDMLDQYSIPLEGIKACNPVMIIDEPHKFKTTKTTFSKILDFKSQFILRYGATFDKQFFNLVYRLDAIDAFNQDLVKGITVHIDEIEGGLNEYVELVKIENKRATFKIYKDKIEKKTTISLKDSLELVHDEIKNVYIEKINQKIVVLSNDLELKKGSKINPYSFSNTLQEQMLKNAVQNHFKLEKEYLTRDIKIKPLSLFFIDDIASYRDNGAMSIKFESYVTAEIKKQLNSLNNPNTPGELFYVNYLNESLANIEGTHGGYFSQDNKSTDIAIESEINEILHDKEKLIDHNNIRRFIFSKWTLKEGWDNPNVFQIVKLRTSGSETSKLQEVGRGLRIPVNQHMERVKSENFELHYFVDFSEKDFVNKLKNEINEQSPSKNVMEYNAELQQQIKVSYPELEKVMVMHATLNEQGIINEDLEFVDGGYQKLLATYPLLAPKTLKGNKVKNANEKDQKVTIRADKYTELKHLWESINQKVILEYDIKNEEIIKEFFVASIINSLNGKKNLKHISYQIDKKENSRKVEFTSHENFVENSISISTLKYGEFLKLLAKACAINIDTIHKAFIELYNAKDPIDINNYLNMETIRSIKHNFNSYLITNADTEYKIAYKNISHKIHPTSLTNADGSPLLEIKASNIGTTIDDTITVSAKYLYNEAGYDSEAERQNIDPRTNKEINEIVVYAKIPKNSVQIPIVGGYTYSPDFAYVIKYADGQKELNLVVETKGKTKIDLTTNEEQRIRHAEKLYSNKEYNVFFKRQMSNKTISDIITEITNFNK